jgi:hypothetical protein
MFGKQQRQGAKSGSTGEALMKPPSFSPSLGSNLDVFGTLPAESSF